VFVLFAKVTKEVGRSTIKRMIKRTKKEGHYKQYITEPPHPSDQGSGELAYVGEEAHDPGRLWYR
jgi:hypothetical protein